MIDGKQPAVASKLLVIVGPTASGKSALAVELARRLNGEIICADSRTVYKGMDISTAKPSQADRQAVPHHLLDVVDLNQDFTVADFKRLANEASADITARGKLPIMVGGSGLYVDSVIFDYQFNPPADARLRHELSSLSTDQLQEIIKQQGIVMPANSQNPRHLIRAIETAGQPAGRSEMLPGVLIVGLLVDNETLKLRIAKRVEQMLELGLVDELRELQTIEDQAPKALLTTGYKAFVSYLNQEISLHEATQMFIKNDYQLAKRQMTWFRRNKNIHWLDNPNTYAASIIELLNKIR